MDVVPCDPGSSLSLHPNSSPRPHTWDPQKGQTDTDKGAISTEGRGRGQPGSPSSALTLCALAQL